MHLVMKLLTQMKDMKSEIKIDAVKREQLGAGSDGRSRISSEVFITNKTRFNASSRHAIVPNTQRRSSVSISFDTIGRPHGVCNLNVVELPLSSNPLDVGSSTYFLSTVSFVPAQGSFLSREVGLNLI
jgi:hypothetical protein